ncbi:hypothetical protein GCM10023322_55900 [Rugosimonospora acidiphila]|uniref:Uncharacterized protein n=1 Tax=Rugosimonospora acidiphila TaxID=556531 RepID=A0ABP9SDS1_9ACTN
MTERTWVSLLRRQPPRPPSRHRAKTGAALLDDDSPETGDAVGEPATTTVLDPISHRAPPDVPQRAHDHPTRVTDRGRC